MRITGSPEQARETAMSLVFPVAQHLLYLARWKLFFDGNRPDKWSAHDAFVLEGQLQKYRYSFVSPALIFTGDVEHHVLPAIAQFFGRWSATRCGRFVSKKNFTSGR